MRKENVKSALDIMLWCLLRLCTLKYDCCCCLTSINGAFQHFSQNLNCVHVFVGFVFVLVGNVLIPHLSLVRYLFHKMFCVVLVTRIVENSFIMYYVQLFSNNNTQGVNYTSFGIENRPMKARAHSHSKVS